MTIISPVLRDTAQTKAPAQGDVAAPAWNKALVHAHGRTTGTPARHHGTAAKPSAHPSHGQKRGTSPASTHAPVSVHHIARQATHKPLAGVFEKGSAHERSGQSHKSGDGENLSRKRDVRAPRASDGKPSGPRGNATPCHPTECSVAVGKDHGARRGADGSIQKHATPPTRSEPTTTKDGKSPRPATTGADLAGKGGGHAMARHARKEKTTHHDKPAPTPSVVAPPVPLDGAHGQHGTAGKARTGTTASSTVQSLSKTSTARGSASAQMNRRTDAMPSSSPATGDVRSVKSAKTGFENKVVQISGQHATPVATVAPPASHAPAQAAQSSAPAQPAPSVPDQVASTVVGLGQDAGGSARIHLHPAALGDVTINVHVTQSGVVNVHMTASQAVGAQALSASTPGLMQHLAQAGFTPGNVQTVTQPQSPQSAPPQAAGGSPGGLGQNAGGQAGQQQQQQAPQQQHFASQNDGRPARNAEVDETVTAYA